MNLTATKSLIIGALISLAGAVYSMPAEAHHHNNNAYMNQLAMQMYANNLALQQQQAMYGYGYNAYSAPYTTAATVIQPRYVYNSNPAYVTAYHPALAHRVHWGY